jgi:hypothetical protein
LAASIAEHGLLQPLIVSPSAGKKTLYDVHAGGRRWRAIGLLIERGCCQGLRDRCAPARTRMPPRAKSALRKT